MTSGSPVVAVVGAGNVGCALAAHLALRGANVRLFNRSRERLAPIRDAGGITVAGAVEGFAEIGLIADTLVDAVAGAEVVAVTVPASALPHYAAPLANAITDDQIIWLNPGQSGGALYLAAEIERETGRRGLKLCELTIASHVSRMTGPAAVAVFSLSRAALATFPSRHLDECHEQLDALLPGQFTKIDSVLQADLSNMNAILHPPGMVCNAGWIDATAGQFRFYAEGGGPAVARVMEALDQERITLAERLGVPTVPFVELFHQAGFTSAEAMGAGSIYEAIRASDAIQPIRAPSTLDHRYLHEDVGWGLVPWIHLAGAVGTPTPAISAVTELASVLNETNYLDTGVTLEQMGLSAMDVDEIRACVGII